MKIIIIGTGNVAAALGKAINQSGHELAGISGRNEEKASQLSGKLKCKYFSLQKVPVTADIYIVAIKDDNIYGVVKNLPSLKGIVAHTSGASAISLLNRFSSYGVFYPVETIDSTYRRSFKKVPFCIEGNNEKSFKKLAILAKSISGEVFALDSAQRATLHVAAVFANNFTNYLLGIAAEILSANHLAPKLLKTLAISTVNNMFEKGAIISQTGPAVRNDTKTIQKHLSLLKNHKDYQQLYQLMTQQIRNVHNKNL